MAVPKRRHSRTRRDKRRSAKKITFSQPGVCPQCKSPKLPHRVCAECGFYDGKQILASEEEKEKKKQKKKKEETEEN